MFGKLSAKRQSGMSVSPLSSAEILAWQRRQGVVFEPFEHNIIDQLDALYVHHQNKREPNA